MINLSHRIEGSSQLFLDLDSNISEIIVGNHLHGCGGFDNRKRGFSSH